MAARRILFTHRSNNCSATATTFNDESSSASATANRPNLRVGNGGGDGILIRNGGNGGVAEKAGHMDDAEKNLSLHPTLREGQQVAVSNDVGAHPTPPPPEVLCSRKNCGCGHHHGCSSAANSVITTTAAAAALSIQQQPQEDRRGHHHHYLRRHSPSLHQPTSSHHSVAVAAAAEHDEYDGHSISEGGSGPLGPPSSASASTPTNPKANPSSALLIKTITTAGSSNETLTATKVVAKGKNDGAVTMTMVMQVPSALAASGESSHLVDNASCLDPPFSERRSDNKTTMAPVMSEGDGGTTLKDKNESPSPLPAAAGAVVRVRKAAAELLHRSHSSSPLHLQQKHFTFSNCSPSPSSSPSPFRPLLLRQSAAAIGPTHAHTHNYSSVDTNVLEANVHRQYHHQHQQSADRRTSVAPRISLHSCADRPATVYADEEEDNSDDDDADANEGYRNSSIFHDESAAAPQSRAPLKPIAGKLIAVEAVCGEEMVSIASASSSTTTQRDSFSAASSSWESGAELSCSAVTSWRERVLGTELDTYFARIADALTHEREEWGEDEVSGSSQHPSSSKGRRKKAGRKHQQVAGGEMDPPAEPHHSWHQIAESGGGGKATTSTKHGVNHQAGTRLSATTLRRDIIRCLAESHPYLEMLAGIRDLILWRSPLATLAILGIYMYGIYRGWLVSLILLLFLLQLSVNYLETQRRIRLRLHFMPRHDLPRLRFELSGAQLVFDVARRAQCVMTWCADFLEKWRFLCEWRRPDVTWKFVYMVSAYFLASLVLSTGWWLTVVGALIGGKVFITTYFYYRFPALRPLLDTFAYFYTRLPTTITADAATSVKAQPPISLIKTRPSPRGSSPCARQGELRRKSIAVIPITINGGGMMMSSLTTGLSVRQPTTTLAHHGSASPLVPSSALSTPESRRRRSTPAMCSTLTAALHERIRSAASSRKNSRDEVLATTSPEHSISASPPHPIASTTISHRRGGLEKKSPPAKPSNKKRGLLDRKRSLAGSSFNNGSGLVGISRHCTLVDAGRYLPSSGRMEEGTLTLTHRSLVFIADAHRSPFTRFSTTHSSSCLDAWDHHHPPNMISGRHDGENHGSEQHPCLAWEIPLEYIGTVKKIHGLSTLGLLLTSTPTSKSLSSVTARVGKKGLQLHTIPISSATTPAKAIDVKPIRFVGMSRCDEFYSALLETMRLNEGETADD